MSLRHASWALLALCGALVVARWWLPERERPRLPRQRPSRYPPSSPFPLGPCRRLDARQDRKYLPGTYGWNTGAHSEDDGLCGSWTGDYCGYTLTFEYLALGLQQLLGIVMDGGRASQGGGLESVIHESHAIFHSRNMQENAACVHLLKDTMPWSEESPWDFCMTVHRDGLVDAVQAALDSEALSRDFLRAALRQLPASHLDRYAGREMLPVLADITRITRADDWDPLQKALGGTSWTLPGYRRVISLWTEDPHEAMVKRQFRINDQDAARLVNLRSLTIACRRPDSLMMSLESVPAETFAPLCKLPGLKYLRIECRLQGLPACIGNLTTLTHLDVRGNHFGHAPLGTAFPASMANLVNLVEFIGFEQGTATYQGLSSWCTKRKDCVPTFETLGGGDDESQAWKCRPLRGHLDDLPFFGLRKLEKFWFDMNSLELRPHFFEKAVRSWPSLRSLDLYDNNITCEVDDIAHLKALPQMQQLLMQGNRVHGKLRGAFFRDWPETWSKLDLSMNPRLEGCLHPGDLPAPLVFKYAGTRVVVSRACPRAG